MEEILIEANNKNAQQKDLKNLQRKVGKTFMNNIQFEEAVQKLIEEYEKNPNPPKGMFY